MVSRHVGVKLEQSRPDLGKKNYLWQREKERDRFEGFTLLYSEVSCLTTVNS